MNQQPATINQNDDQTAGYGSALGWSQQIERMRSAGTRVSVGSTQ